MIERCNETLKEINKKLEIDIKGSEKFTNEKGIEQFLKKNVVNKKTGKYDKARGYYLFQIPGSYLNTQPFGGFNFTDGKDSIYDSPSNFTDYLTKTFVDPLIPYAVEIDPPKTGEKSLPQPQSLEMMVTMT